jgi:hypothetical protein
MVGDGSGLHFLQQIELQISLPHALIIRVQQTGAAPAPFKAAASDTYGVGAFLMAGSEIRRMGGVTAGAKTGHNHS